MLGAKEGLSFVNIKMTHEVIMLKREFRPKDPAILAVVTTPKRVNKFAFYDSSLGGTVRELDARSVIEAQSCVISD